MLVTAAAGTGIGFATAKRCVEEGATVMISDIHERRLGEAATAGCLLHMGALRLASDFDDLVALDDVAFFEVLEVLDSYTALEALSDGLHIVLEAAQGV